MSGKRQRKEQLQGNPGGGSQKRSALAWMLCVALAFGSVCVPEYAGMPVQAAGLGEMSVQAAESAGMPAEMSKEMSGEEPEGTLTAGFGGEAVTEQEGIEEHSSEEECSEENYSSWDAADGSEEDGVPENGTMLIAEDDIASGVYGNITWRIDADGKLTVEGTGEFSDSTIYSRAPWYNNREAVKTAEIHISGISNASYIFSDCINMMSVDLSGFDTGSVTNMARMFAGCSSLTSLDVSGFDTSSVTNMGGMFSGCSRLTSVAASGFDTSKVTDMSDMFDGCSSLTDLDVSGFDTGRVRHMGFMFSGCSALKGLDVSGFDTGRVRHMGFMFSGCSALKGLDVSGFDTGGVVNMCSMFSDCSSLTSLDLSGFDINLVIISEGVSQIEGIFDGCSSLTTLYTPCKGKENMSVSLPGSVWQDSDGNEYTTLPEGLAYSILLEKDAKPETAEPKLMVTLLKKKYFQDGTIKDGDIRVSYRSTDGTTRVITEGYTLGSVDMSTLGEKEITVTYSGLTATVKLKVLENKTIAGGSYENITWRIDADGKLIVEGTGEFSAYIGGRYRAPWYPNRDAVESAEIHISGLRDASSMFYECQYMTSVDLSGFDTSGVTNMYGMFYGCNRLTSVDLSKFDTGSVTDMNYMFSGCGSLKSLDVSAFDTSKVTGMYHMFSGLYSLKSLDLSGFDTGSVTSMSGMFEASGLTSLDLSGFDTGNVTMMHGMFFQCNDLTSLDVSGFDTGSVRDMSWMFESCSGLTSLDLSGFDMGSVRNADTMFSGCNSLTILYTPYNVPAGLNDSEASLPIGENDVWYGGDGTTYTTLPVELDHSILLTKGAKPDAVQEELIVNLLKNTYEQGSRIKPEDLRVRYRAADGTTTTLSLKGADGNDSGYTLNEVDMNTLGEKKLTVSYDNGTKTLTKDIIFKVVEKAPDPTEPGEPGSGEGNKPDTPDSTGLRVTFPEGRTFTYTGSPIKPAVKVTNNGESLTEGVDYTVKYTNNTKAGTAKLTVTVKGSFTGRQDTTFTIEPKSLQDEDIVANAITIAANTKAAPVIIYNGTKLGTKDYTLSNTGKITADTELTITGKGNYKDSITIKVNVVEKTALRKFKVSMNKGEKHTYNGDAQIMGFEVTDSKTGEPLKEDEYTVVYSGDLINAGTVKVTVTGLGIYSGSVTKAYKINPLKTDMELSFDKQKEYTYNSQGTTVDGIMVKTKTDGTELEYGKDYKITYSSNKKAGTAKINVTFLGNYKGSKALKDTFAISPAVLDGSTVNVTLPDKAYTGRKNAYKSAPIVTDKDGNALKTSDYTAAYYADRDMTKEIKGKENLVELAEGEDSKTIYVKITGKGSYAGIPSAYARGEYSVKRTSATVLDLSKAKVTFKNGGTAVKKLEYTGLPLTPDVEVTVKVKGAGTITLDASQYDITWINNTNKGKATAVITGNGTEVNGYSFVGSRNATFTITSRNLKNVKDLFGC